MGDGAQEQNEGEASVDVIDGSVLLLAGFSDQQAAAVRQSEAAVPLLKVATIEEVDAVFTSSGVSMLALGPGLSASSALDFLDRLEARHPYQNPACVLAVELAHDQIAALQEPLTRGRVFFVAPPSIAGEDLARLAHAGVRLFRERMLDQLAAAPHCDYRRAVIYRKLQITEETLLETTALDSANGVVFDALGELTNFAEARLWRFDWIHHELILESYEGTAGEVDPETDEASRASAASGLVAFVATTAETLVVESARDDARWDVDTDGELPRLVAAPILGAGRRVLGVLAVSREAGAPAFDGEETRAVEELAEMLVPLFARTAPRPSPSERPFLQAGSRGESGEGAAVDLFRKEAVEANARGFAERGSLLRSARGWTRSTWWLLAGGLLLALALAAVVPVDEFASGPALLKAAAVGDAGMDGVVVDALLPSAVVGELGGARDRRRSGRWLAPDGSAHAVSIESVERSPAVVAALRERLGEAASRVPGEAVVVRARWVARERTSRADSTEGGLGTLEITTGSRSVLSFLLPGSTDTEARP